MSATADRLAFADEGSPLAKTYRRAMDAVRRVAASEPPSFDACAYGAPVLEEARAVWRLRVTSEYASSTVFAQLAVQVIEANAPMDAAGVVLRMAQEEVRHAEIARGVLRALGDDAPIAPIARVRRLSAHPGVSPAERALRNVLYGSCLSEVVNTARFVDALDTMSDPFMRAANRELLADEVGHGQFGFLYLEACRPWLDASPETLRSVGVWLEDAFARIEQEMAGARMKSRDPALADEARALGLPDRARYLDTFATTMEHAVVPGLERFGIDAGQAWRKRSISA